VDPGENNHRKTFCFIGICVGVMVALIVGIVLIVVLTTRGSSSASGSGQQVIGRGELQMRNVNTCSSLISELGRQYGSPARSQWFAADQIPVQRSTRQPAIDGGNAYVQVRSPSSQMQRCSFAVSHLLHAASRDSDVAE
jgi:hypothetical protein